MFFEPNRLLQREDLVSKGEDGGKDGNKGEAQPSERDPGLMTLEASAGCASASALLAASSFL